MPDTFVCYRRFLCKAEGSTFVVIASERDYSNGMNTLRNIVAKDEMPQGHTLDRGRWSAQGIANVSGRHVFLYIEYNGGSSCGPVFPIDDGSFEYMEERGEVRRDYSQYIGEMQKEGRWQGDKEHPKYPWRKDNVLS